MIEPWIRGCVVQRIMFRGGPYGGDKEYARRRQKEHGPFPEHGPDEGALMGAQAYAMRLRRVVQGLEEVHQAGAFRGS